MPQSDHEIKIGPPAVQGFGIHECAGRPVLKPPMIVLTGGPGAGKTAVLELVLKLFCKHVAVVPESASIIFSGGFPRRPSPAARKGAQRSIFAVQKQLERLTLEEDDISLAICDRGTLDGLAYWPGSETEYWSEVQSSKEAELTQYAGVIHLRTPSLKQGYNHINPMRTESPEEALKIDERLLETWKGHPNRILIESQENFLMKARQAFLGIQKFLPEACLKSARTEP